MRFLARFPRSAHRLRPCGRANPRRAAPARCLQVFGRVARPPAGIAHTFMAVENLKKAAQALGYEMKVETQGLVGARGPALTFDEIGQADTVIIAADALVDDAVRRQAAIRGVHRGSSAWRAGGHPESPGASGAHGR